MSAPEAFVAADLPRGMSLRADISQAFLLENLSYDAGTGEFRWLVGHAGQKGRIAGHRDAAQGYVFIRLNRRLYCAHRLAWLAIHGRFPSALIDHANGVRHDNRIANLRECSPQDNLRNRRCDLGAASGYKGVRSRQDMKKYQARIHVDRKEIDLGWFATALEASKAYDEAASFYFREFARPNHAA